MSAKNILLTALFIFSFQLVNAQILKSEKVGILHFNAEAVDEITIKSSELILKQEIENIISTKVEIQKYDSDNNELCLDEICAINYGKEINADKVVMCNFLQLGQKIVIQYSLFDIKTGEKILSDSFNSNSLEDLDTVMKRIAMSVTGNRSAEKTAEVGVIIEDETREPLQRSGSRYVAFSMGYFFPTSGFEDDERTFTIDMKIAADVKKMTYGIQVFGRNGFGVNLFSNYLLTNSDITPYVGAGFGFHWVTDHNSRFNYEYTTVGGYSKTENKKGDGFEILFNGGLRLFRTYKFQLNTEISYSRTFNDFNSSAVTFTIGIVL